MTQRKNNKTLLFTSVIIAIVGLIFLTWAVVFSKFDLRSSAYVVVKPDISPPPDIHISIGCNMPCPRYGCPSGFICNSDKICRNTQCPAESDCLCSVYWASYSPLGQPPSDRDTAEELLVTLKNANYPVQEIDHWVNGGWESHVINLPFNNFAIKPGEAFLIKFLNNPATTWPSILFPDTDVWSISINLQPAWNFIGLPERAMYKYQVLDTEKLCQAINSRGGSITEVQYLANNLAIDPAIWNSYKCGSNTNKVSIFSERGYFVKSDTTATINFADPSPTPIPTPVPTPSPLAKRVFVTSTRYNGNLGGLSGADSKCQDRANAVNLGGTWKAWLSDNTTSASSRLIHSNLPYKLLNGSIVANNWTDLTDGTISNAIKVTELLTTVTNPPVPTSWTNTNKDGSIYGNSCKNWLSNNNADMGTYGQVLTYSNYMWTWSSSMSCGNLNYLYCFEQ